MPYADWSYNARNPLQRYSHRRRFEKSCQLVERYLPNGGSLLDYGCADGFLLSKLTLRNHQAETLHGYEPFPDSKVDEQLTIFNSEDEIAGRRYDVVSCFEVLEHFSESRRREILGKIKGVLSKDGVLIISVPVESGPVGMLKGVLRKATDPRLRHQYTWRNIWRTLWGLPLEEWREGEGYLDHIGFYYRDLRRQLEEDFDIERTEYSPMPLRGTPFNSQIYVICRRKG